MTERWELMDGGGIRWRVANGASLPHSDHLEMSGRRVSLIVRYGVDEKGRLNLVRDVIWPTRRTKAKDYRGYLEREFGADKATLDPIVTVNGKDVSLRVAEEVRFDGRLAFTGTVAGLEVTRILFPSMTGFRACERLTLRNVTEAPIEVKFKTPNRNERDHGVYGTYNICATWFPSMGFQVLEPGEDLTLVLTMAVVGEKWNAMDSADETDRVAFVEDVRGRLILETPDPVINEAFALAKVRAAESVFDTALGLVHSPGGGRYYGGVWANDQAEYSGPFFGLLGEPTAREAAHNAYRIFAAHTNLAYRKLPSSIEVEGDMLFEPFDRGDAAMIAWGASRFVLLTGDESIARDVWPLIDWCLEYCRRRRNKQGIIESESDELEGRFPSGSANLCTSTLAYGGFRMGARVARALGVGDPSRYEQEADDLRASIEKEFGAEVQGFQTYRYYNGNKTLRAWICLPLVMGITERAEQTVNALFSPDLWTEDGLATESGSPVFWDRSTLYGLQGVFAAGQPDRALEFLEKYTRRRLLGDHVPYAVEAHPEGNQAHLSAESALFCRVFTDGVLGIHPAELHQIELNPSLPTSWDRIALRSIEALGTRFDIEVFREDSGWRAVISQESGRIEARGNWGSSVCVDLKPVG